MGKIITAGIVLSFLLLGFSKAQVLNKVTSPSPTPLLSPLPEEGDYKVIKNEWLQAQKRIGELKGKKEELQKAKKEALIKAKRFILSSIERVIKRLERISARVERMKVITEERKTSLISEINSQIDILKEERSKIEAATTKEELIIALRETREKVSGVRGIIKKIVDEILASHIDKTLERLNQIAKRLEEKITELKSKGVDVVKFETTLAAAKDKLTQVKAASQKGDYKLARRLAEEARAMLVKLAGQLKAAEAKSKSSPPLSPSPFLTPTILP